MASRVNVVADDYGLSPGVSGAIRELIDSGTLTGTGCMTLFPEWLEQSRLLRQLNPESGADIGLHLTLTDFAPLSRWDADKNLPSLPRLLSAAFFQQLNQETIDAELDAQLDRFVAGIGRLPDFIDGHQHVHFLPAVRRWLEARTDRLVHDGRLPWLRGAPLMRFAPDIGMKAKIAFVGLIAAGFDRQMTAAGFPVRGPLVGFYNWKRPGDFFKMIDRLQGKLSKNTVLMCHPGWVDETLIDRDKMILARPTEFNGLRRQYFR
ncbi:ChbG/HpnK family deacetylase [Rhizobium sp. ZPR3]|uniref:ChbG/HpnK family deacetylase n=2 Tax=unclassified Rhizobium TaxID=2613769 RepID=A0AAU7SHU7_9HYPH